MASDKQRNGKNDFKDDEGGLGNLPPLSDFDSGGFKSDSDLPPLGGDSDKSSVGGLPPITELSVETPNPTGGNIKAPPPGFQMSQTDFESPQFETPGVKPRKGKAGFQDPAADSDFSPETPEIGPGPDSDMDTPMFDSAFGGGGAGGGFAPAFDTPAPTQAMETPMFGAERPPRPGGAPGFDDGAFAPAAFDAGTPAPDFSPDTAAGAKPPLAPVEMEKKKGAGIGGPKSMLVTVLAAVIALVVGVGLGPFIGSKISFLPNPLRSEIAGLNDKVAELNKTIQRMTALGPGTEGPKVSQEQINELLKKQEDLTQAVTDLTAKEQDAKSKSDKAMGDLERVRTDLEAKNEEYVKTQEAFEDLQNQTAIVQARQMGLKAEVERLTGLVGTLEEASERVSANKQALMSSVNQLLVEVKEGIPLTPEKFARDKRLAAVQDLKAKVDEAKWVTPALLDAYTSLYKQELEIGASTAYFFARLTVTSKLNEPETKWAECLMKGNWAVYYRTIDGKNVGSYENLAEPGATPRYGLREQLPEDVQKQIASEIGASRPPGYDQKIKVIAGKQAVLEGPASEFQKVFSSL